MRGKAGIASALLLCSLGQLVARDRQPADTTWKVTSGAYAVSIALDWQSTHAMLQQPGLYETNPLLGRHPSDARLGAYMVLAGTGTYLILNQVRESGRPRLAKGLLLGITFLEIGLAARNRQLVLDNQP